MDKQAQCCLNGVFEVNQYQVMQNQEYGHSNVALKLNRSKYHCGESEENG